jgi:hypothetical protein
MALIAYSILLSALVLCATLYDCLLLDQGIGWDVADDLIVNIIVSAVATLPVVIVAWVLASSPMLKALL